MKNQLMITIWICMILLGCNSQPDLPKDETYNSRTSERIKKIIQLSDSLISVGEKSKFVQVLIESSTEGKLIKTNTLAQWVDSTYKAAINIVNLPNSQGFAYVYVPFSESGDFLNTYTYYFDQNEKIRCYKRDSRFFNSTCSDDMIKERNWRFFDEKGMLIEKKDSIFDANGFIIQDSTSCINNYRFPVPLYLNKSDIPNLIE